MMPLSKQSIRVAHQEAKGREKNNKNYWLDKWRFQMRWYLSITGDKI